MWLTLRKVLVPQLIRIVTPPSINLFSDIVKVSSLLSLIGVAELTYRAAVVSASTYRYFEMYTTAGIIYMVMIISISTLAAWSSRRFSRYQTRH
jgi:polar amino acid transport system permease protein